MHLRNSNLARSQDLRIQTRTQMQVPENGASGGAKEKTIEQEIEALDESLLSDDSGDEFDSMVN